MVPPLRTRRMGDRRSRLSPPPHAARTLRQALSAPPLRGPAWRCTPPAWRRWRSSRSARTCWRPLGCSARSGAWPRVRRHGGRGVPVAGPSPWWPSSARSRRCSCRCCSPPPNGSGPRWARGATDGPCLRSTARSGRSRLSTACCGSAPCAARSSRSTPRSAPPRPIGGSWCPRRCSSTCASSRSRSSSGRTTSCRRRSLLGARGWSWGVGSRRPARWRSPSPGGPAGASRRWAAWWSWPRGCPCPTSCPCPTRSPSGTATPPWPGSR